MDTFHEGVIQPTLIKQVRKILDQYPDDGQILKEVIQNAEDAGQDGASKIIFLIDNTNYGTTSLHQPDMKDFQGPALYVYNDAVFSEEDWNGIRTLHESNKEKNPIKVGRFGLGFKSVFHMTDLPSIFSGKGIGFIDPHQRYFKQKVKGKSYTEPTSTFLFNLEKNCDRIASLVDQFTPFKQDLFGVTQDTFSSGYFNGTMFRFPFRIEGSDSELSDTKYTPARVKSLIDSLIKDAENNLLFLRNLQCIEIYERNAQGCSPVRLLDVHITDSYLHSVRATRKEFTKQMIKQQEWNRFPAISVTYPISFDITHGAGECTKSRWIVTQYYAGSEEVNGMKPDIRYLPLVGTALQLQGTNTTSPCIGEPKGQIFCFLPLPLETWSPTGLRAHVHGSFAVDQNRRHLKWPSADMDQNNISDPDLKWNQFLIGVVLPKATIATMIHLVRLGSQEIKDEISADIFQASKEISDEFISQLVYALIPEPKLVLPNWKKLAEVVIKETHCLSIFYTAVPGGSGNWYKYKDVIFDTVEKNNEIDKLIRQILTANDVKLACVPTFVFKALPQDRKETSIDIVFDSLRRVQYRVSALDSDASRSILLKYIADNTSDKNVMNLVGLKLLPLSNGQWIEFKTSKSPVEEMVYVGNNDHSKFLLPNLKSKFMNVDIMPKKLKELLVNKRVTTVMHLDQSAIMRLLPLVFQQWSGLDEISLKEEDWFDAEWLDDVWIYLQRNFRSDLGSFENLPLLPAGGNKVARLKKTAAILNRRDESSKQLLSQSMVTICAALDIRLVEFSSSEAYRHERIWNVYVLRPEDGGLIKALCRVEALTGIESVIKSCSAISDSDKVELRKHIAKFVSKYFDTEKNLLQSLPVFKTSDGSGNMPSHFVSLRSTGKLAAPTDEKLPVKSPCILLDLSDESSQQIAKSVGVVPGDTSALLAQVYLPAVINEYYTSTEVEKLFIFICDNLQKFKRTGYHATSIIEICRKIRFIYRDDSRFVVPMDAYDKTDATLCKLFAKQNVFVCGEFSKPRYVSALKEFGLKTCDSITADEILAIAQRLSEAPGDAKDLDCAEQLLHFLNMHVALLSCPTVDRETLKFHLQNLRWVRTVFERPSRYPKSLDYAGSEAILAEPVKLIASKHLFLIGSIRPTISTDGIANLAKEFKWNDDPPIEEIGRHVINIVTCYNVIEKIATQDILDAVHRYLNEHTNLVAKFLDSIKEQPWVWNGETFSVVSEMAFEHRSVDLKPYIFPLPPEVSKYKKLWQSCGVKPRGSYVDVLQSINNLHSAGTLGKDRINHDVKLSVNILNEVSKDPGRDSIISQLLIPICTKDESLQMKAINECAYCDKEWYEHDAFLDDLKDDNAFLIHEDIPLKTAMLLGLPSLVSKTLGAEEFDIGYGQYETLTRRLNALLKDYNDGLAVLKELIQNADDAGAKLIHFVYDERENADARTVLLDKGMKELQGPALWAYNDAKFTREDFDNIVKLSGATKEHVTQKVGRFGVGFNVVYNLTDVPMFISSSSFVIFDPHKWYLGQMCSNGKPGIRLNLTTHSDRIKRLSDQFKPFNGLFDCDLTRNSNMSEFEGTLFRFPLRTQAQSRLSEISKLMYSKREMMTLLKLLSQAGHNLMLFTQNVIKISVSHLADGSTDPSVDCKHWFTIEKDTEKIVRGVTDTDKTQNQVLKHASSLMASYRKSLQNSVKKNIVPPKMELTTLLNVRSVCGKDIPDELTPSEENSSWLIVSCLGQDNSLQMSLEDDRLIAIGGVAAKLEKNSGMYQAVSIKSPNTSGQIFCFMPLPIQTTLPVHINGYFEIHSSRTHLYEQSPTDKDSARAKWNEVLLEDAITRAYIILIEDLIKISPKATCYAIWPTHGSLKEAGLLSRLTESFYQMVSADQNGPRVIQTDGQWIQFQSCILLEVQSYAEKLLADTALSVLKDLCANSNMSVVELPYAVIETMLQTTSREKLLSKFVDKTQFFKERFLPHINDVDPCKRDKLVLHAIFDKALQKLLSDIRCISTSCDGTELKPIMELVDPESKIAILFDADERRFPMFSVEYLPRGKEDVFSCLAALGMKRTTLDWSEIYMRCNVIQNNPNTAGQRIATIVNLIDWKLNHDIYKELPRELQEICHLKIVPVMPKPENFPVSWKGDEYNKGRLTSFKDAYLKSQRKIVCCSHPIIDEDQVFKQKYEKTKEALGLKKNASITDLITQLNEICQLVDESGCIRHLNSDRLKQVRELYDETMYYLNVEVKKNSQTVGHCMGHLKSFATKKCIFIEKKLLFVQPNQCALKFAHSSDLLLEYLAEVPEDTSKKFPELLKALDVKKFFALDDYISVLNQISANMAGKTLTAEQLEAVLLITNQCMLNELKENAAKVDITRLNLPNATGVMCLASTLSFNNCLWLSAEKQNFCHDRIPHPVAEILGIRTTRSSVLQQHRISQPFGQKEKLVTRIKHILDSYPFSEDILKEMLQNADDAGATEIHFILDPRNLPTERIIGDNWKDLQGPALCVYNNKWFSKRDHDGIQSLGEGSKSDDPIKTGQYGVGFNCVYHVTDVPTYLTSVDGVGAVLCIFDPNCKYAPEANEQFPGAMYDVGSLTGTFADVFLGYLQNQTQYDISKPGTVFRLPLRNLSMSKLSEVSKKIVTVDDIRRMFEVFKQEMYETLLFVNNIQKICLMEVKDNGDKITTECIYSVEVEMPPDSKHQRNNFNAHVKARATQFKSGDFSEEIASNFSEVCYELTTKDSGNAMDKWQIVQRFGFTDPTTIDKAVISAVRAGDLGLLPRGGVAYLKSSENRSQPAKSSKRVFCFLPLPILTELPVHVNGHFVLAHESRRGLYTDDHDSYKVRWNKCVMERVVAPAYCTLLCEMRDSLTASGSSKAESKKLLQSYFDLFPMVNNKEEISYITDLTKAVYGTVGAKNLAVLPIRLPNADMQRLKWLGPIAEDADKPFFDNLNSQIIEKPKEQSSTYRSRGSISQTNPLKRQLENHEIARNILCRCGFQLFLCNFKIYYNFEKAGVKVAKVEPKDVLEYFSKKPDICKNGSLPQAIADTCYEDLHSLCVLLEYCTLEPNFKQLMTGLPYLVTHDNVVRIFDNLDMRFATTYVEIANAAPDMFIHQWLLSVLALNPEEDLTLCKALSIPDFGQVLNIILPVDFCGNAKAVTLTSFIDMLSTAKFSLWLKAVWSYLASFLLDKNFIHDTKVTAKILNLDFLHPISGWCILPAVSLRGEMMFPLCRASEVLTRSTTLSEQRIENILDKLGIARPIYNHIYCHNGMFDAKVASLLTELLGSLEKPVTVAMALRDLITTKSLNEEILKEPDDCLELLSYFSKFITTSKNGLDGHKDTLRSLPFYVTVYNKVTALNQSTAFVLPSRIPNDDLENWTKKQSLIFLKEKESVSALLQYLECKLLSVTEVYSLYIFENFSLLSTDAQQAHMNYVRRHVRNLNDSKSMNELEIMQACLKKLAFIPSGTEHMLFPAENFYDPRNDIFKSFETSECFPPDVYSSPDWLRFLRECGLIHEVSTTKFIDYAKRVEREATKGGIHENNNHNISKRSQVLFAHFMSMSKEALVDLEFLYAIKGVRFIPPYIVSSNLSSLHQQLGAEFDKGDGIYNLVAFERSITPRHQDLVWTAQNILPFSEHHLVNFDDKSSFWSETLSRLGVVTEPLLQDVINHMKTLCNGLGKSKNARILPVEDLLPIMTAIYKFLTKSMKLDKAMETMNFKLSNTQCIILPDAARLVRPDQLSININYEEEIAPFLFKCPDTLMAYSPLFLALGSTKTISCKQYAEVLKCIYHGSEHGSRLHEEEKRMVTHMMKKLFHLLQKMICQCDEDTVSFPDLFLPCRDKKLYPSNEVIYIDQLDLWRIKDVDLKKPVLIDFCGECNVLNRDVTTVFLNLPQENRPIFLSSLIKEELDSSLCLVDCKLARSICTRFESTLFKNGLERLIRHCLSKVDDIKPDTVDKIIQDVLSNLKNTEVIGHDQVRTQLVYDNMILPESARCRDYFFEDLYENGFKFLKIHIKSTLQPSVPFYVAIANRLTSVYNLSDITLQTIKILQIPDPTEITKMLDDDRINPLEGSAVEEETFCAPLGTFVPRHQHDLLVQDHFIFRPKQFAALEVDDPADRGEAGDPTLILVEIIERVVEEEDDNCDSTNVNEMHAKYRVKMDNDGNEQVASTTLLYERVVKEEDDYCESTNVNEMHAKYRIKIDNNGSEQVVSATLLYAFCFRSLAVDGLKLAVILFVGNTSDSSSSIEFVDEEFSDFSTMMQKIKQMLKEAFQLPEIERKKAIKRICFRYHPDKHMENTELFTKVFQRLQQYIDLLNAGKSIDDPSNEQEENVKSDYTTEFQRGGWGGFGAAFWDEMQYRARRHNKNRHRRNNAYKSSGSWSSGGGGGSNSWSNGGRSSSSGNSFNHKDAQSFFRSFTTESNPQPNEARRWLRQANLDLTAAINDGVAAPVQKSFEWMAYKCYQAAKKALRAAQYAQNSNNDFKPDMSLRSYCLNLDPEFNEMAFQLETLLGGSPEHTQYPCQHPIPSIPHDAFTEEKSDEALAVCEKIVRLCSEHINHQDD